jgi:hypothetical protein
MKQILLTHIQGQKWKVHTQKPNMRLMIHSWSPELGSMILLESKTVEDKDEINIYPGEFLSYLDQFGMIVPVLQS